MGASGGGWDEDEGAEGAGVVISEAEKRAKGEVAGSLCVVVCVPSLTASNTPVSMLNRRSSC